MQMEPGQTKRLAKKQKLCAAATTNGLAAILECVRKAQSQLQDSTVPLKSVLSDLQGAVKKKKATTAIANSTRDLHNEIKAFGKVIEDKFEADICLAARKQQLPKPALNQVIVDHLYRDGHFDVGDTLAREAGLLSSSTKAAFVEMHEIMSQMRGWELHEALKWTARHRDQLLPEDSSAFEFQLHTLLYLRTLTEKGPDAALAYARAHFAAFQAHHMLEIQRLICCLVYSHKLPQSPYAHLLDESALEAAVRTFVRVACTLVGEAADSPLLVAVAAGSVALPQLLKLVKVMGQRSGGHMQIATCTQMPLELELGPEFCFHSIFACPVSREQSDAGNPPMLLPCGHVLCLHSVNQLPRMQHAVFKCPYCPSEVQASNCRRLYFPDVK